MQQKVRERFVDGDKHLSPCHSLLRQFTALYRCVNIIIIISDVNIR